MGTGADRIMGNKIMKNFFSAVGNDFVTTLFLFADNEFLERFDTDALTEVDEEFCVALAVF